MSQDAHILLVEDETDIAELVEYNLRQEGFAVKVCHNGQEGLSTALAMRPVVIVLDIMLPGMDGLTILKNLQEKGALEKTSVIMLTAKGEEADIVAGLELGADDYLTKPFSPKELVARIKAIMRRSKDTKQMKAADQAAKTRVGHIDLDPERHIVHVASEQVPFTLAEFRLLQALMSRPGRVFTRDQLLEKITGGEVFVIDRNVDVHVRAVRKKLGDHAEFIETVRGVGYKCREE